MSELSFRTSILHQPYPNAPTIDLDVEVVYEFEQWPGGQSIDVLGIYTSDGESYCNELDATPEQLSEAHVAAVSDFDTLCDLMQAMAEDAADARAEMRREIQQEELAMRGRQYAEGERASALYQSQWENRDE